MAKVIQLNKVRFKKFLSALRIPLAIIIIAAALLISFRILGNVAVSNVTDSLRQMKYVFSSGKGFPLEVDGTMKLTNIGGKLLTVYDDSCSVLNSTAKEQLSLGTGASELKTVSENGRALLYSRKSGKVVMLGKTEKLGEITEEKGVVTAALSRSGGFATGCFSNEAQSVLSIYNNNFKKIFQWNCSQERFTDISLSGNGKKAAVAAVGAENAEIYTRLLVFDVDSDTPKVDLKFEGTLFFRVKYTASGKIVAAGDNRLVVLNKKGEVKLEIPYSEDSIVAFDCDDDGNIVLCYKEFGGSKTSVVRISSSGKQSFCEKIDGVPDCVDINGTKTAIASDGKIFVYAPAGNVQKTIEAEGAVSQIVFAGNRIYALENGTIRSY